MVWESVVFMSWCAIGSFQIIASWANIQGLSFFNKTIIGYIFGAVNIVAAFFWFFTTIEIGESGAKGQHYEQIASVLAGVSIAGVITGSFSSVIKYKLHNEPIEIETGLDIFKRMTPFQLLHRYYHENIRRH